MFPSSGVLVFVVFGGLSCLLVLVFGFWLFFVFAMLRPVRGRHGESMVTLCFPGTQGDWSQEPGEVFVGNGIGYFGQRDWKTRVVWPLALYHHDSPVMTVE